MGRERLTGWSLERGFIREGGDDLFLSRRPRRDRKPQVQGGGAVKERRMTGGQVRRVKHLIRHLCANYDGGSCLLLDDGEPCVCPQSITNALVCRYFKAAVLPSDRELCAELTDGIHNWKRCALCGRRFIARSNRAMYCGPCGKQEKRRRGRERVRRHRGRT